MGLVVIDLFSDDNETVTRTKLNGLVADLVTEFNGNISNANISDTANINITKITVTGATAGDIIYHNGTSFVRLGKGTAGQVLTMNAGGTAPEWQTP